MEWRIPLTTHDVPATAPMISATMIIAASVTLPVSEERITFSLLSMARSTQVQLFRVCGCTHGRLPRLPVQRPECATVLHRRRPACPGGHIALPFHCPASAA